VKNSTGKRSAAAFKLKPTMAFAGQATVGAFWALAATGTVFAQAQPAASAPAPAAAASGAADAQQVVVTGIRRGIEAAISVKKNSDQIVEAISAEDIGKLPDTTIAESLARLPGLTAQRDKNGNATNVSIRGLGPDFNGYLLNGREQTSTGDGRAVDLSVYPAELIASATVYKTSDATLVTAGLAGTIDERLIDPLSMPSRVFAISGENTETGRGLQTPGHGKRYSLAYVDQFADRKIGIALGFVHANGKTNQQGTGNWGNSNHTVTTTDNQVVQASLPGWSDGLSVQNTTLKDDRDGLAGVLEFRPNSNFTSEIDFYHAKIKTGTKNNALKIITSANGGLPITNATVVGGVVQSGTLTLGSNADLAAGHGGGIIDDSELISDNDTLQSFGWKNSLKLSDTWRASADVSHNSAKRVERDVEIYAGLQSIDHVNFTMPNGTSNPVLTVDNPSAYTTPGSMVIRDQTGWSNTTPPSSQLGYMKGPTTIDKLDAMRLDFTHDLQSSLFSDMQFGVNVTKRTKTRQADEGLVESATGGGFDTVAFPAGAYIDHNVGNSGLDLLTFDPTISLAPGLVEVRKFNDDILSKSWGVKENVSTAYGKLDIDTEMGKIPVHGNVGLQYVYTEQSSDGYRAAIGSGATLNAPSLKPVNAGTNYSNVLPSLNLVGDLGNGNILRFGASIQMARTDMTQMRNAFAISDDTTNHVAVGSAGNPNLKPFKAKALDLSYEKYFAGGKGYLSGALFYKKLDTYVVQQTAVNYDFTELAQAVNFTSNYDITKGVYTTSVNGHGGNLKGIELSASAPFSLLSSWLEGFGATASYSNTTSSVRLPNLIGLNPTQQVPLTGQITMPGLSHLNEKLMLYFERWGFSAFIAENSRSKYVGSVANNQVGGYPSLTYIEPQKWVSAQVGYEVQSGWLKGLAVRLEGNNLNKPVYKESNFAGSITNTNKTGASVDLRVSYKL
jgi:iron complex outermembrane receptor protein